MTTLKKILLAVALALPVCGCISIPHKTEESYVGQDVIDSSTQFLDSSVQLLGYRDQKILLEVGNKTTDKAVVEKYSQAWKSTKYAIFMPFHGTSISSDCYGDDSDVAMMIALDIGTFGIWLAMDASLGTLMGLFGAFECKDKTWNEYVYKNETPYESGSIYNVVGNREITLEIKDIKYKETLTSDSNGKIHANLTNHLPDEPTSLSAVLHYRDQFGSHSYPFEIPAEYVALALKDSPKRRYAYGPPSLTATVRFSEPSGNNFLDAEETGKLIVTVTNSGRGDAFNVTTDLSIEKTVRGITFERSHDFGTVPSGKSVTRELSFAAGKETPSADHRFTVAVREAGGFDAEPLQVAFRSKAFEHPKLMVADLGIDDLNGNAKIEPQEIVEVTARVQNVGYGIARRVMVDVVPGENVFMAGEAVKHFDLGDLAGGKFEDVKFSFYTNRRIANGEIIPIRLLLSEERSEYQVTKPLELAMNAPQKRAEEIVVKGEEAPRDRIELAGGLSIDVDQDIPSGQQGGRDDIAVVIGNRNYQRGTPNVEFAQRDARIMKEYLIQTLGFEEANIFYEEDAGLAVFNSLFGNDSDHRGKLFNNIREGKSRVFIYYVGHGVPDPNTHEAFFLPVDADTQSLRTSAYRLQTFYDNLAKLPAREITVVLDACFSGNSAKGELIKGRSGIGLVLKANQPTTATVFTSAQDDQYSVWHAEKKHSLFTYYFLKGLRGEADGDRDRRITVAEMETYLKEEVPFMARKLMGTPQQPTVSGNKSQVIAQLK